MKKFSQAQNFKKLRESIINENGKECTQRELGKILYIPYSRISDIENGKRPPSLTEIKAYHIYFKSPYEYLFGETDNKEKKNIDIGKELGLTDPAIKMIKQIFVDPQSPKESIDKKWVAQYQQLIFNLLLESDIFPHFIEDIWGLSGDYLALKDKYPKAKSYIDMKKIYKRVGDPFAESDEDDFEYHLYKLQESTKDMAFTIIENPKISKFAESLK